MRIIVPGLQAVAAAGIVAGSIVCLAAGAEAPLVLERTIPLDHVSGRIDHMAVDVAGRRLFVAELGNGSVDAVDLQVGRVVSRIGHLKEPQGVAYVARQGLVVTADAGDGVVRFYRTADSVLLGTVMLGDDADNVRLDPATGQVLVGYGGGGLAVIDPATRSRIADIKLAGHPESFQIDPRTRRAYVNVPDAHQIAIVDLDARRQVAAWRTPGLAANFPMALADPGGPLAVAFRSPPTLALLDPGTGRITQRLNSCGDADDVFFDARRRRIYVSCGEGVVDIFRYGADGLQRVGRVPTARGARTALFVPQLDRLFAAAPAGWLGGRAALMVFRPSP